MIVVLRFSVCGEQTIFPSGDTVPPPGPTRWISRFDTSITAKERPQNICVVKWSDPSGDQDGSRSSRGWSVSRGRRTELPPEFEKLLDWYLDVFGLEKRSRGRIEATANVPGMNMSFGDARGEHAPTIGRSIDHIGFELEDLEAFCEQLKEKGIEFDVDYHQIDSIKLKVAFITDPAGTHIELTEGYDGY